MKQTLILMATIALTLQAQARLDMKDSRMAGLMYGFLSVLAQPENAGDGVLVVTSEVSCNEQKSTNPTISNSYYCMADIGGITGDVAEKVYNSMTTKGQESFDNITVRTGNVTCNSVELSGKAPRFSCN